MTSVTPVERLAGAIVAEGSFEVALDALIQATSEQDVDVPLDIKNVAM